MFGRVVLYCFARVVGRMQGVGVSHHIVMGGSRVIPGFVVSGSVFVVFSRLAVVLGCLFVVIRSYVLSHKYSSEYGNFKEKSWCHRPKEHRSG